ncbi:DUF1684 domain-containing protein [Pseudolysobacter antarcticus]|uniref:DUF1684 domain-containing protein n=1 Tax=Pseudolysobacter antarcticus TaxID=2511995 RepID=A0A411HKJ4_9GAMM|nr:DUF1684 domain-containing protein [Pseudolysobacter antarcticus]QBB70907.1 DUF1684 domain-containing protein [Pseudolysobacter antarcticus]
MKMLNLSLLFSVLFAGVGVTSAGLDGDYTKQIDTWRAQRLQRLQAPNGWLSLIGLPWLKDGSNSVGSAKDNDVVLTKGPAHLGKIVLKDGKATITLDLAANAQIDGKAATSAELLDDSHEKPTTISFGNVSFYLIDRSGRKGLRVKDTEAETRTHFVGLDNFPTDPKWRIEAKWIAYDPPHELEIPSVIGTVDKMPVPGKAVFERDGHSYELLPVLEEPDAKELWFIIADKTSGKETYGSARFLYAEMPKDGKIVIDFNKAYNPPCAFTPYATCPLAPPENRLTLAVTAGEKKYRGSHH